MLKWRLMQSAKYPDPVPPIAPFTAATETSRFRLSSPARLASASVRPAANSAGYARSGLRVSPSVTDPPTAPTIRVSFSPRTTGASFSNRRRDETSAALLITSRSSLVSEASVSGPGNDGLNARSLCSWVVRVHPSGQRSSIGSSPSAHAIFPRASTAGCPASSPPRVPFASATPPESDARSTSCCARIGRTACTPAKGTPHSANTASARRRIHGETPKRVSLPHRAMWPPVAPPAVLGSTASHG